MKQAPPTKKVKQKKGMFVELGATHKKDVEAEKHEKVAYLIFLVLIFALFTKVVKSFYFSGSESENERNDDCKETPASVSQNPKRNQTARPRNKGIERKTNEIVYEWSMSSVVVDRCAKILYHRCEISEKQIRINF